MVTIGLFGMCVSTEWCVCRRVVSSYMMWVSSVMMGMGMRVGHTRYMQHFAFQGRFELHSRRRTCCM